MFTRGMQATVEKVRPSKCWWYHNEFSWEEREWSYVEQGDDNEKLTVQLL